MADEIDRSRGKQSALVLVMSLLFTGCTSTTYESTRPPGPSKPAGYPIPLYNQKMEVPRPCEIIGTMTIDAGRFIVTGGSFPQELQKLMQKAHEKGADAVKLTAVRKPSYTNPNSSLRADLLRYTDLWEIVATSPTAFQAYLHANHQELDPVEGVWTSPGSNPHSVGIMKDKSKPGREFVGFILESANPAWPVGAKKMELRRGVRPGSYALTYYLDDFEPCGISLVLGQKRTFVITVRRGDADDLIFVYSKK